MQSSSLSIKRLWLLSLLFGCVLNSFSCPTALAWDSSLILTRSKRRSPCCWYQGKSIQSFTIKNNVGCKFLVAICVRVRKCPSIASLLRVSIRNACWTLWNVFCIYRKSFFILLILWIILIDFQVLSPPCVLGINHKKSLPTSNSHGVVSFYMLLNYLVEMEFLRLFFTWLNVDSLYFLRNCPFI